MNLNCNISSESGLIFDRSILNRSLNKQSVDVSSLTEEERKKLSRHTGIPTWVLLDPKSRIKLLLKPLSSTEQVKAVAIQYLIFPRENRQITCIKKLNVGINESMDLQHTPITFNAPIGTLPQYSSQLSPEQQQQLSKITGVSESQFNGTKSDAKLYLEALSDSKVEVIGIRHVDPKNLLSSAPLLLKEMKNNDSDGTSQIFS